MRRTLVTWTTAFALVFSPAAAAQTVPQSSEVNQQFTELTRDVPREVAPGSAGLQMLANNPTEEQRIEAAVLIGLDWLIGVAAVAVIGGVVQAISAALP